jgi:thiaminase
LKTNGSKSALLQSWIESLPDDQANGMWVEEIVRVTDECLAALNRVRHLDEIFWISSSYEFMLLDMCLRDEKWQLLPA